jgi:hypothetical protein
MGWQQQGKTPARSPAGHRGTRMPAGGRTGGQASGGSGGGATYRAGWPAGTVLDLDGGATTRVEEGLAGAGAAVGRGW